MSEAEVSFVLIIITSVFILGVFILGSRRFDPESLRQARREVSSFPPAITVLWVVCGIWALCFLDLTVGGVPPPKNLPWLADDDVLVILAWAWLAYVLFCVVVTRVFWFSGHEGKR